MTTGYIKNAVREAKTITKNLFIPENINSRVLTLLGEDFKKDLKFLTSRGAKEIISYEHLISIHKKIFKTPVKTSAKVRFIHGNFDKIEPKDNDLIIADLCSRIYTKRGYINRTVYDVIQKLQNHSFILTLSMAGRDSSPRKTAKDRYSLIEKDFRAFIVCRGEGLNIRLRFETMKFDNPDDLQMELYKISVNDKVYYVSTYVESGMGKNAMMVISNVINHPKIKSNE